MFPAGIATPWWDDVARGGAAVKPDTSKFLTADDVAASILMLVNQSEGSDIDQIVLRPTVRRQPDSSARSLYF